MLIERIQQVWLGLRPRLCRGFYRPSHHSIETHSQSRQRHHSSPSNKAVLACELRFRTFPPFIDSTAARPSAFSSINSANLINSFPRSAGVSSAQAPSKASLAAATATSTSSSLASWTAQITLLVAGLIASNVFPDFALTNWLLMNNPVG